MLSSFRTLFHRLSFLQYPLFVPAIYYMYRPLFRNLEGMFADMNLGLVFFGLAISFSTLQDTSKTHYKLSERIFRNPRLARVLLLVIAGEIFLFLGAGLFGILLADEGPLRELSMGILFFGIGLTGLLKAAVDMAEYQQNAAGSSGPAENTGTGS